MSAEHSTSDTSFRLEWWEKSPIDPRWNWFKRVFTYTRPFRRRYGHLKGVTASREFSRIENLRTPEALPIVPPGWHSPVWLRPNTLDPWVYRQLIIGGELDFETPPLRRILDAGANIGLATRIFLTRWPEADVISVEPEAENYALMVRNTSNFPNVHPVRAAVWQSRGSMDLDLNPALGSVGFRLDPTASGQQTVPTLAISDLLDQMKWDSIDLLKLDIEGAEREVLNDASRWIDRVGMIAVELHERFAPGCQAAFEKAFSAADWEIIPHGEYLLVTRR